MQPKLHFKLLITLAGIKTRSRSSIGSFCQAEIISRKLRFHLLADIGGWELFRDGTGDTFDANLGSVSKISLLLAQRQPARPIGEIRNE